MMRKSAAKSKEFSSKLPSHLNKLMSLSEELHQHTQKIGFSFDIDVDID